MKSKYGTWTAPALRDEDEHELRDAEGNFLAWIVPVWTGFIGNISFNVYSPDGSLGRGLSETTESLQDAKRWVESKLDEYLGGE